jgi:hypothetical protein
MTRPTTGTLLLIAATLLYCTYFLSAAMYGSSAQGWNADLFDAMLQYVGPDLLFWSKAALVVGIIYLLWAEVTELKRPRKGSNNP